MSAKLKNDARTTKAKSLPDELFRFATEDQGYTTAHNKIADAESVTLLKGFLSATLDEVRLHYADKYAFRVLKTTDIEDACHFRQGVLRREASGDVEYQKQRDHAAHTLHNYLLGWYIYENSVSLRKEMGKAMALRLSPKSKSSTEDQARRRFLNLWPYPSLLHDIGYLFEGGLEALRVDVNNERVKRGAQIVQEYFRHRFWSETPLAAATERTKVRKWTGIAEPDFSPFTVTAVGDSLRTLGNLETLWGCVINELNKRNLNSSQFTNQDFKEQGDAFKVWRRHYEAYSPKMVERVKQLEKAYYSLMWDGLLGISVRVLDHGVAGGLLQLLYSTYYFQMHFGVISANPNSNEERTEIEDLKKRIAERVKSAGVVYNAHWWWAAIVWATGATALHNLQQQRQWPGVETPNKPLTLEEDPLAYLGILVDILEEWDRYTVSRVSIFTGELPLQATDVMLDTEKGKIRIQYDNLKRADKVRKALDVALHDWNNIVLVLPSPPPQN